MLPSLTHLIREPFNSQLRPQRYLQQSDDDIQGVMCLKVEFVVSRQNDHLPRKWSLDKSNTDNLIESQVEIVLVRAQNLFGSDTV